MLADPNNACKSVASVELILAKFKPRSAFDRGDLLVFF